MIHEHHEYEPMHRAKTRQPDTPISAGRVAPARPFEGVTRSDLDPQSLYRDGGSRDTISSRATTPGHHSYPADHNTRTAGPVPGTLTPCAHAPDLESAWSIFQPYSRTARSGSRPPGTDCRLCRNPGPTHLGSLDLGISRERFLGHPRRTAPNLSQDTRAITALPLRTEHVHHLHSFFSLSLSTRPHSTAPLSAVERTRTRCGSPSRLPGAPPPQQPITTPRHHRHHRHSHAYTSKSL